MGGLENKKAMSLLRRFKKDIRSRYNIERAILFGSRAGDDWLFTSDVDVILVSRDFEGIPFRKRIADVLGFWDGDVDMEVLCYTPEEFRRKKNQIGIVRQAEDEGISI